MKTLPNTDPMFASPQNIQDLIYLLAGIVERKLKEKKNRQNEEAGRLSIALTRVREERPAHHSPGRGACPKVV